MTQIFERNGCMLYASRVGMKNIENNENIFSTAFASENTKCIIHYPPLLTYGLLSLFVHRIEHSIKTAAGAFVRYLKCQSTDNRNNLCKLFSLPG